MKFDGLSKKAMQFQLSDENINLASASEEVRIRFVEIDGWIRVMMEVGENTTSNNLRTAIPLALDWRDRLIRWQGPRYSGDTALLEQLHMRHKGGESYATLAEKINHQVEKYLEEYVEYIKEYEEVKTSFKTYGDFYSWQSKSNPSSINHARDLLEVFRVSVNEIDE